MNRYLLMKTFGEEKDVCLGLHIVLATTDTCIIKSTCYLELDSFFFFSRTRNQISQVQAKPHPDGDKNRASTSRAR